MRADGIKLSREQQARNEAGRERLAQERRLAADAELAQFHAAIKVTLLAGLGWCVFWLSLGLVLAWATGGTAKI